MAAAASVTVSGSITGLPDGSRTVGPVTISSAAAVGDTQQLVLQSGANTINVPARATGAVIVFDSTSTVVKTLKGITGDTGIALKKAGANLLTFEVGAVASFVITAASTDTGLYTTISFF